MNVIYPGTFDPITNGHVDLVERAARIFDQIIVAVAEDPGKHTLFPPETRVQLCREAFSHINGVELCAFRDLLVDLAREKNAPVLRGLRALSDFEAEFQMANMNRAMQPEVETFFLTSTEHLSFVSSSLVKEIASLHGDISSFVPPAVNAAMRDHFGAPNAKLGA